MATVPIVTEVTKAQLDTLVAANGLNEGLQYKVTDKEWLLTATGSNTYTFIGRPYKVWKGYLTQNSTSNPVVVVIDNTLGDVLTWIREEVGIYTVTSPLFLLGKTLVNGINPFTDGLALTGPNLNISQILAISAGPLNIKIDVAGNLSSTNKVGIKTTSSGTNTDGIISSYGVYIEIQLFD